jgi:acetolactate synthase-1/3 small subunit
MSTKGSYIISILVENEMGVLSRVAGLFSGRGYNISSLAVAETLDPSVSRITLTTTGDAEIVEQINKQLNKLVSVIKVVDYSEAEHVERELALIKVAVDARSRLELVGIADIFRARIVDVGPTECMVEVTGDDEKIAAIMTMLAPLGIKEVARTGKAALFRGGRLLTVGAPNAKKNKSTEKAA